MTGSFTFKWAQPAGEVYVTGSFDDWGKSTKLNQEGDAFIATVSVPSEKILYKYVVDGIWTVDLTARREAGDDGIENNVLLPEDLVEEKAEPDMSSAAISSVAPDSTTAALAAQVPKETNGDFKAPTISSVSPDSTTAAMAAGVTGEARTPSLKDVPGGFPQTPVVETSDSHEGANEVLPSETASTHDDNSEDPNGGVKLDLSSPPVPPDAVAPAAKKVIEQKGEAEGEGVSVVQPNTEGNTVIDQVQANIAVAAATVTATVGGIAAAAGLSSASGERNDETASAITPDVVEQSQEPIGVPPEASSVGSAVEAEKPESPATSAVPPASEPVKPVGQVPEVVDDSLATVGSEPEATDAGNSVEARTVVENQLKDEVKPVIPVQLNTTGNAPTSTAAPVPTLEVTDPQEATTPLSPTTPVEPTKNGTPENGSPRKSVENGNGEPPASPTQLTRKKNRFSFFGNLKDKLHFGKDKGKSKGEMSP